MKVSEKQIIFTLNISYLIAYANSIGIGLTFGEAYRTKNQQKLYYYGLTIDDNNDIKKTSRKSKTMNSNHLRRLAVDFNFFIDGKLIYDKEKLQCLGDYWEELDKNNKWGGNYKSFTDTPHFEMRT